MTKHGPRTKLFWLSQYTCLMQNLTSPREGSLGGHMCGERSKSVFQPKCYKLRETRFWPYFANLTPPDPLPRPHGPHFIFRAADPGPVRCKRIHVSISYRSLKIATHTHTQRETDSSIIYKGGWYMDSSRVCLYLFMHTQGFEWKVKCTTVQRNVHLFLFKI